MNNYYFWLAQGLNRITCDPSDQIRDSKLRDWPIAPLRRKLKIVISYARGTGKDSTRKFVTLRSDTGMNWTYSEITSSSFGYNKYLRRRYL